MLQTPRQRRLSPKTSHFILLWLLFVPVFSGCSQRSPKVAIDEKYEKSLGDKVQQGGLMSSDEWMKLHRLGKTAGTQRKLDDGDFQQLIGFAQQKASGLSPSTSVVSVHITAMSIFRDMTRSSSVQKRKIIDVVTPFLSSSNQYERIIAKQVTDEFKGRL